MSEYDVDGIPHFVFLDAAGRKQGQVVGRLPKEVLRSNADALVAGAALPYAKAAGAPRRQRRGSAQPRLTQENAAQGPRPALRAQTRVCWPRGRRLRTRARIAGTERGLRCA